MQQRSTLLKNPQALTPLFQGHFRLIAQYHRVVITHECVVTNEDESLVTLTTDYHLTLHHALRDLQERYSAFDDTLPKQHHLWPLSFSPDTEQIARITVDYQPTDALVTWFQHQYRCDSSKRAQQLILDNVKTHLLGHRWLFTYLLGSMPTQEHNTASAYHRSWSMPLMANDAGIIALDLNPLTMIGIDDSASALVQASVMQAILAPDYWTLTTLQEANDRHLSVASQAPTQRLSHEEQMLANHFLKKLSTLLPLSHDAMKPIFEKLLHDVQEGLWLPRKTLSSQLMRRVTNHSLTAFAKRQLSKLLPEYQLPDSLPACPPTGRANIHPQTREHLYH